MSEIEYKFKDLYESLKETIRKTTYVRPSTLIEFDIESIMVWYLIPKLSIYGNYMDFHMSLDFLCFRLRIRLCPDIFKSPMEYDYFSTPYIVFQYYEREEFPYQIEIGWIGWFYRYCFGGKTPEKITKYHRTRKFIRSFDEIDDNENI